MTKRTICIALLVTALLAAGLYVFGAGEMTHVIRLSESQIQEKLDARMPFSKSVLFIFKITLANPQVRLKEQEPHVHLGLDVLMQLGDDGKPLGGRIEAAGAIRYDSAQGAFFLVDPVVERVAVQGIPERYTDKVNAALSVALAAYWAQRPIYTLSTLNGKQAAARLVLRNVAVENGELVVTLGL